MYIYNITFPIEASRLDKLLGWLRGRAVGMLSVNGASSPQLSIVDNNGCDLSGPVAESVALQLRFSPMADFGRWESETLPGVMREFSVEFAPEPLFFATLLRLLDLE